MPPVLRVALLAAFEVVGTVGAASHQHGHRGLDVLAFSLLLVGPASLLALTRLPWLSLGLSLGSAVLWFGLDYPGGPVPAAFGIAIVFCAVRGLRVYAWGGLAAAVVALWSAWLLSDTPLGQALGSTAWLLVLVTVGEQVRSRHLQHAERRHAHVEEERRRVSDERLRIAQELHDVLAHSVSLISVQAGVALHLLDADPGQARRSLETIRDTSRDTMAELRATVGALRSTEDEAPLRPTPGLADLEALTRGVAAAGVQVATTVTGERRPLPAGVDLAAYRIVQEALTNVARHSGADRAVVDVSYGASSLRLRVMDAGSSRDPLPPVVPGNGLTGMRERAVALGGTLVAGPRPTGGFAVEAELPL